MDIDTLNQFIEQIKPAMEKMAEKLGIASEFLWKVLIKQQLIEGIFGIGWFILGCIMIGFNVWLIKKTWRWIDDSNGMLVVPYIVLAIFGVLAIILGFGMAVNHLVNPEWQAIKDIFEFIEMATPK